jgi:hypothetical protein
LGASFDPTAPIELSKQTSSLPFIPPGLLGSMRFSLLAVAAFVGSVLASNVVDLDPDNFDSLIGKGKPALVELCVLFASYLCSI